MEQGNSVQQTSDGGYIVAGMTSIANDQVYLIKTNAYGDTLWTRNYGGTGHDLGYSVQQTSDGGYIVAGMTGIANDQVYLIKTNAYEDTLWTRNYGGTGVDIGYSVQQTSDGGYIIAGIYDLTAVDPQLYLIKTDTSGDTQWTRTYGGTGTDGGYSVQQTADSGYIIAGYTTSIGNYYQAYLIKTNSSGDTLWTKSYGGTLSEKSYSVDQTFDNGYILVGTTNSFGNSWQVYIVKTNGLGDTVWTRIYGGMNDENGFFIQQTSDTGYILVGNTDSFGNGEQVYLVKLNSHGDIIWTRTYGGTNGECGYAVQQTADKGYIITGASYSFGNGCQVYLIKTDSLGISTEIKEEINISINTFNYTTILSGPLRLPRNKKCRVFDIAGRMVMPNQLKPGVYFIQIDGKMVNKIIKVK